MKKILSFASLLFLFLVAIAFAAGTTTLGTTESIKDISGRYNRRVIPITFTADGAASFANYTFNPATHNVKGWYLYSIKTDPGSTGPTNGAWDLDITDAQGLLVSRNLIDDRSSTATQEVIFTSGYPMATSTWTISIGDNAVNNASVTIYLTFTDN